MVANAKRAEEAVYGPANIRLIRAFLYVRSLNFIGIKSGPNQCKTRRRGGSKRDDKGTLTRVAKEETPESNVASEK